MTLSCSGMAKAILFGAGIVEGRRTGREDWDDVASGLTRSILLFGIKFCQLGLRSLLQLAKDWRGHATISANLRIISGFSRDLPAVANKPSHKPTSHYQSVESRFRLLPSCRRYFHNSGQAPFRSSWLASSFTCGYASTSSFLGQQRACILKFGPLSVRMRADGQKLGIVCFRLFLVAGKLGRARGAG
jgi:hypothetical protein